MFLGGMNIQLQNTPTLERWSRGKILVVARRSMHGQFLDQDLIQVADAALNQAFAITTTCHQFACQAHQ